MSNAEVRGVCFSTTLSWAVTTRDHVPLRPTTTCVASQFVVLARRLCTSLVNSRWKAACSCRVRHRQTLMRHLVVTSVLWGCRQAGLVTRRPTARSRSCLAAALSPPLMAIYCLRPSKSHQQPLVSNWRRHVASQFQQHLTLTCGVAQSRTTSLNAVHFWYEVSSVYNSDPAVWVCSCQLVVNSTVLLLAYAEIQNGVWEGCPLYWEMDLRLCPSPETYCIFCFKIARFGAFWHILRRQLYEVFPSTSLRTIYRERRERKRAGPQDVWYLLSIPIWSPAHGVQDGTIKPRKTITKTFCVLV